MFAYIGANINLFFDFSTYLRIFMHIRTYLKKMRRAICYKMNVSRASGAACGSSYGRFCIFIKNIFLTILRILEKLSKNSFWVFGVVAGHSGILENSIFWGGRHGKNGFLFVFFGFLRWAAWKK